MAEPFLIGESMTGGYGPVDILHSCTLAVEPGEIAVIVGPNGAGKSTAMKAVFGMLNLRQGSVRLAGEDITRLTPQARVRKGMGFVPQTQNIFTGMTVEENLEMGAFIREDEGIARRWRRSTTCSRSCGRSAIRRPESCPAASASRSPWAGR